MTVQTAPRDNRRLIVRIMAQQLLGLLAECAEGSGEDMIAFLVFTGVWAANTEHLSPRPSLRYAQLDDIPPDSLRRPIRQDDLAERLRIPRSIVAVYVRDMLAKGVIEETETGLVVPRAVFARSETLDVLNGAYSRILGMVRALRDAGMSFGEEVPDR